MQSQLDLLSYRPPAPSDSEVERFFNWLYGRGWVNYRAIRDQQGWTERQVRSWASASDGRILSGQKGYCRLDEATPEEIRRSHEWLKSQAREMLRRSIQIRRRAHALLR